MKTEIFADGSTITTDEITGNQTVVGKLAHDEYFKRLNEVKILQDSPDYCIVACCRNIDGTRKAELIRRKTENPITLDEFGPFMWEVWSDRDPENTTRCINELRARHLYATECLFGTNGPGTTFTTAVTAESAVAA